MYGYSPKNKEERLKLREFYLTGYTAVENADADCVIATAEEGGRYLLRIFDGTAAYPCINCYYRTAEQRQREIDRHVKNRLADIQAKEARKQAKNAAGDYVVDESKPHFEAGREYFMTWYGDDPYEHTATIRIIKRSACFVTLVHVYSDREDDPRRVKVSVDHNGEYLSYGSFYFFRASSCVEQEPAEEVHAEQDAATQSPPKVLSVSFAPWIEEAVKARREAAQRHLRDAMETLEMLTDEQLTAAVLISPKDNPDVARFFLQELSRRDAQKALAVLRAWKEGLGPEDIDRLA